MEPEFGGIEKRLDELKERLAGLDPFRGKLRTDFACCAWERILLANESMD